MKLSLEEDIECPKCHEAGGLYMWERVQGYMRRAITFDTAADFEYHNVYDEAAEIDETIGNGIRCKRCNTGFDLEGTNTSDWAREAYEAQCKRAEKKECESNPNYAVRKLAPQEEPR